MIRRESAFSCILIERTITKTLIPWFTCITIKWSERHLSHSRKGGVSSVTRLMEWKYTVTQKMKSPTDFLTGVRIRIGTFHYLRTYWNNAVRRSSTEWTTLENLIKGLMLVNCRKSISVPKRLRQSAHEKRTKTWAHQVWAVNLPGVLVVSAGWVASPKKIEEQIQTPSTGPSRRTRNHRAIIIIMN